MANLTTVARPYVKAILQLAKDDNTYDEWSAVLEFLSNVVADPLAIKLLSNRAIPATVKVDFICDLEANVLTTDAKNLVRLLAASKRLLLLPEIYRLYEEMRKQLLGDITIHLTLAEAAEVTAVPPVAANVTVVEDLDPALIGGGIAQIGNRVIDASLVGRLIAMRDQLRQ